MAVGLVVVGILAFVFCAVLAYSEIQQRAREPKGQSATLPSIALGFFMFGAGCLTAALLIALFLNRL